MRRWTFIVLLCLALPLMAQESIDDSRESIDEAPTDTVVTLTKSQKVKRFFAKVADFADRWFIKNVDTAYLALPKHRFKLAFVTDEGSVHTKIHGEGIPYYDKMDMYMRSNFMPKMGFQVGFRNLSFGYSWNLHKGYNNFKIGITQNGFGIELQQRKTSYAKGYVEASAFPDTQQEVQAGEISINTFYLSSYLALNRKKFSMPAAFNHSYIQKRSAGSPLLFADFIYQDISLQREKLIEQTAGLHEMEIYQIAIGAGYGYNYTPNKGKFLLHVSGAVLLCVFNQMLLTGDSRMFYQTEYYSLVFSQKVKPQYPVHVTGRVKVGLVYNINDYCYLAISGVVNNIRFRTKDTVFHTSTGDTYDNNPVIKLHIMTWDWNAVLTLAARFL